MARGMGGIGGGLGGLPRSDRRGGRGRAAAARDDEKKRKAPPFKVVLRDAIELVSARRGRLAVGFGLLAINRLCSLVLPGTTKFLLDEVIGKGRRELLGVLVLAAGGATFIQAVTSFSLSQVLGKAAQRSITEMRRRIQSHVGRLSVSFFDQTKTGALLSRVMSDAEGLRNLVGSGLVEVAGGLLTAAAALVILFYLSAKLTLIALSVLSLFGLILLLRVQDAAPALSGALADQRGGFRPADRVVLRHPRRQGLPRGAARGARVHEGSAPPLPQRGEDDDRIRRRQRFFDASARDCRGRDHVGRRKRGPRRKDDARVVLLVHALHGTARRPGDPDRVHRKPDHGSVRGARADPRDPQRNTGGRGGRRQSARFPASSGKSSSATSPSSTRRACRS